MYAKNSLDRVVYAIDAYEPEKIKVIKIVSSNIEEFNDIVSYLKGHLKELKNTVFVQVPMDINGEPLIPAIEFMA